MATVLVDAAHQVVSEANVERAVVLAGEHVDIVLYAALQSEMGPRVKSEDDNIERRGRHSSSEYR